MYIVKVTDEKMYTCIIGKPPCLSGDESVCNTGDTGWIPGLGRSCGERNGNPLQYSCLEIPLTEESGSL